MRPPRRWELMITLTWNTAEQTWHEQCVSGEYQDGSIYYFISTDNTEITVSINIYFWYWNSDVDVYDVLRVKS